MNKKIKNLLKSNKKSLFALSLLFICGSFFNLNATNISLCACSPSIAFISSGTYAGDIATADYLAQPPPCINRIMIRIFDTDGNLIARSGFLNYCCNPSIAFISSGTYAGDIAEIQEDSDGSSDLSYNVIDQNGSLVLSKKITKGYNPSITFIPSGKCAGDIAFVYATNNDDIMLCMINQDGVMQLIGGYNWKGHDPSITYITSGTYAGGFAITYRDNDNNSSINFINQNYGKADSVNYGTGIKGRSSITFIPSGTYAGDIAEVHQANNGLWFDVIDQKGIVLYSKNYGSGYSPALTDILGGDIAELHVDGDGIGSLNIIDLDGTNN